MNEDKDSFKEPAEAGEPTPEEGVVCTACVEINPPRTDYCSKCGAPLNSLVGFNPFDQTLLEGFAYRRAVEGPPSKIVLAGIWLLLGPMVLTTLVLVFFDWRFSTGPFDASGFLLQHVYWFVCGAISAAILYRATANFFRKRPSQDLESA